MDVRRRSINPIHQIPSAPPMLKPKQATKAADVDLADSPKASDALPLPLYLTNGVFFTLFFTVVYYLLVRWREKIRNSTPLHVVTLSEIAAIVTFVASFIYLLGFLGIGLVQPFTTRSSHDDIWGADDDEDVDEIVLKDDTRTVPCAAAPVDCPLPPPKPKVVDPTPISPPSSEEDEEIIRSVVTGTTPSYVLETKLGDCHRAAAIRREALQRKTEKSLAGLPLNGFDYDSILGQCCEMPVGYIQIPVGIAGPLLLDVPKRAAELKFFLENPLNYETLATVFNRSSRFGKLQNIKCAIAGKNLFMRFSCSTGDAMGMNMVSKGVQNVLDFLQNDFADMDVIGISGNYCSDKKPAAVNWIEGRGKSVVCEAVIKEEVVKKVLKTNVASLVELNMLKNLTGSAMAGALGGFNAHASNIVSAVFLATGQDPAQNVESSHCITMMEPVNDGKDLHISVTMPSIEVGTVGGGTQLASQSACLNLLGVKGACKEAPGSNARLLATIVAGSVLAGELSLMSALAAGQLVNSHMKYNRSSKDVSKASS
ncbi:hypothetical protein F0562_006681 [Nyssa sinensis]|uniref:hydroxymethylglutaryl-CoA reductase (NADPH) n=1 Tax=Nyssa sinensis TaxID=561372 RepID=A0A5J5AS24_9ASTE|nr:hypothetical protein F0562_006681 [Nyssa sinensis]